MLLLTCHIARQRTLAPALALCATLCFGTLVLVMPSYGYNSPRRATVSETDSLALVALYNATGGDSWENSANWLAGPVASWFGITTSSDRVVKIDLLSNGLRGSIPPEIGGLTMLDELILVGNHLEGAIPAEISGLENLRVLAAADNFLTGSLPPEVGSLQRLEQLFLHSNRFSGSIPPEIGNLRSLAYLVLANTGLSGQIPNTLGKLAALQHLDVSLNELSGTLPDELAHLKSLTYLSVSSNPLTGPIPLSFIDLTDLEIFYFNGTELCEPEHVDFQAWLSGRVVSTTGRICFESVATSDSLALVAFYQATNGPDWASGANWLTAPVDNWTGVSLENNRVVGLQLDQVIPSGSLPDEMWTLDSLKYLILSRSNLTGGVPEGVGQLTNLVALSLQDNQLSGPLPPSIGNLTNLNYLNLSRNQLEGPLPAELGQLSSLEILDLAVNNIAGGLPEELGNLASLLEFSVSFNPLEGPIPESFIQLSNLATFGYSGTELCEPNTPEFQAWLDPLGGGRTGNLCSDTGGSPTADEKEGAVPDRFAFHPAYPNPTARQTLISYELPQRAYVEIVLFDVNGSRIRTVVSASNPPGRHNFFVDSSDLPSGAYVLHMRAETYAQSQMLLVVK